MSDVLKIQSYKGEYEAHFGEQAVTHILQRPPDNSHFIVDRRVAKIYANQLEAILSSSSVLQIEATEQAKSLDRFSGYVEKLVSQGVRRNHMLFAIGGGSEQSHQSCARTNVTDHAAQGRVASLADECVVSLLYSPQTAKTH